MNDVMASFEKSYIAITARFKELENLKNGLTILKNKDDK
jgi:hypothetical protein